MLLFLKDKSHLCFIVFGARTHSSSQQKWPPGWALKYIIITTYSLGQVSRNDWAASVVGSQSQ